MAAQSSNRIIRKIQDQNVLIGIFPLEMWCLILRHVDTDTLISLSNASLFFRSIFLKRRTAILFEKTWSHLKIHLFAEEDTPDVVRICESCGKTRDIGTFRDYWILCMRMVCKQWCAVVDKDYESESCDDDWNWTKHFTKSASASQFLKHFKTTHDGAGKSPFVGSSVELELQNSEEKPYVNEMLVKYGQYVKDCLITDAEHITAVFYQELKQWLLWMSNLEELKLNFFENYSIEDDELYEQMVTTNPLSPLAKLRHLHISGLPHKVLSEIIRKNPHVNKLSLDDICSPDKVDLAVFNSLDLKSLTYQCMRVQEFELLEKMNTSPKLTDIDLQIYQFYVPWERLFLMLEQKWGSSLEEVYLNLPSAETAEEELALLQVSPTLRLCLPKVRELSLILTNATSFDFLLPMKNLEKLYLNIEYKIKDQKRLDRLMYAVNSQMLAILDFQYRMYESNIWKKFPRLTQIEYDMHIIVNPELNLEMPRWITYSNRGGIYYRSRWSKLNLN